MKSQSQHKPTLLLLLPFHHLLAAVGLFSWVALELTLVVMDRLGTGGTVACCDVEQGTSCLPSEAELITLTHSCSSGRTLGMLPALLPGGGQCWLAMPVFSCLVEGVDRDSGLEEQSVLQCSA